MRDDEHRSKSHKRRRAYDEHESTSARHKSESKSKEIIYLKSTRHNKHKKGEVIEVHGSSSEDEKRPINSKNSSTAKSSRNIKHSKKDEVRSRSPNSTHHSKRKYSRDRDKPGYREVKQDCADHVDRRTRDDDDDERYSRKRLKDSRGNDRQSLRDRHYSHRSYDSNFERQRIKEERDQEGGNQSRSRHERQHHKEDNEEYDWGQPNASKVKDEKTKEKQKPDFALSGKLTEDKNMYKGVVIKYSEPPEARMPKKRWRLYQFKGDEDLPTLYIHRQSAYLVGRDRKVADLPVDHPSCSKQHAALQYRMVTYQRPDGSHARQIRLYIIDLESANGTYINNKKIEAKKYVELLEKDVIKFGFSSREYVLLHEGSKDDEEDGDAEEDPS